MTRHKAEALRLIELARLKTLAVGPIADYERAEIRLALDWAAHAVEAIEELQRPRRRKGEPNATSPTA